MNELVEFGLAVRGQLEEDFRSGTTAGETCPPDDYVRAYAGATAGINATMLDDDPAHQGRGCNQRLFELSSIGVAKSWMPGRPGPSLRGRTGSAGVREPAVAGRVSAYRRMRIASVWRIRLASAPFPTTRTCTVCPPCLPTPCGSRQRASLRGPLVPFASEHQFHAVCVGMLGQRVRPSGFCNVSSLVCSHQKVTDSGQHLFG